ncbi:hypothetical protein IT417_00395 [bacterium]|nr:hypothetical protein [bacterium]
MDLSDRQKEILLAVIKEFMDNATEVGSVTLVEKYGMNMSSATIRSEMVRLMDQGFLEKSHISSGRFPTDQAIRLYVQDLLDRSRLSAVDQAVVRQELFKVRFSEEELVRQILQILVNYLSSAAFVVTNGMNRYFGVSSLMKYEELKNIEVMQRLLDILEDRSLLHNVFSRYDGEEVSLLIGSESGIRDLEGCTIAFTKVTLHQNKPAHMGVIGSRRMNYSEVIPMLKSVRNSVEDSLRGWR